MGLAAGCFCSGWHGDPVKTSKDVASVAVLYGFPPVTMVPMVL